MIMFVTMVIKMMIMANCFCKHLVNPKALTIPVSIPAVNNKTLEQGVKYVQS